MRVEKVQSNEEFSGASMILFDKEGRILLQHRDSNAGLSPNRWNFFGGHVRRAEDPLGAVVREIKEEVNFSSTMPEFITQIVLDTIHSKTRERVTGPEYVYAEECTDKTGLRLMEGDGWGWFTLDEALRLQMTPHQQKALPQIRKIMQKRFDLEF